VCEPNTEVVVKLPVEPLLRAGEHETLLVRPDEVLFFDGESSRTVATAA
jgi:hypothetical protein